MDDLDFSVRPVSPRDKEWVLEVVRGWGADFVITRGRKVFPTDLPAFVAEGPDRERRGLVTYEIVADQCEIVTLDAFDRYCGIGTALIEKVREASLAAGCRRLWLITTNDNIDAIRFYQKRRFTIAAVHINALERSRALKPTIPKQGQYGIPMRDEVEFEMWLSRDQEE